MLKSQLKEKENRMILNLSNLIDDKINSIFIENSKIEGISTQNELEQIETLQSSNVFSKKTPFESFINPSKDFFDDNDKK